MVCLLPSTRQERERVECVCAGVEHPQPPEALYFQYFTLQDVFFHQVKVCGKLAGYCGKYFKSI